MKGPTPYGAHIPFDQGYDAKSRTKVGTPNSRNSSGYLKDADGNVLDLWISDITADFSISGVVGQSRMLREWFPRSFNDVVLTITGNAPNTQEYNRIATFIRVAQWKALQRINANLTSPQTITFGLHDRTPGSWKKTRMRNVKGPHRPWLVQGYVPKVSAGATAHEIAPEYTITFVVAESELHGNTGIWSDQLVSVTPLKSILQILGPDEKVWHGEAGAKDPISSRGGQFTGTGKVVETTAWSITAGIKQLGNSIFGNSSSSNAGHGRVP